MKVKFTKGPIRQRSGIDLIILLVGGVSVWACLKAIKAIRRCARPVCEEKVCEPKPNVCT